jgi:hypothetical protein
VFYREQYGVFAEKHAVSSSAASLPLSYPGRGGSLDNVFIHIMLIVPGHRKYQIKKKSRKEVLVRRKSGESAVGPGK